jgi:hypothetical protein
VKIIRSNNFIENLNSVYKRREIQIYNNEEIMSLCKQKPRSTNVIDNKKPQSKVKESIVNNNIEFFRFWDLYNKKVGDKKKCEVKWYKLTTEDHSKIMELLPAYLKTIKDKQYQPYPETWLNQRRWENEDLITKQHEITAADFDN